MRIIGHLLFWALSYAVIFIALSIDYDAPSVNHVMTMAFHLPLILLVYMNAFLFKFLFLRSRYFQYGLGLLALVPLGGVISHYLFSSWTTIVFPHFFFVSPYTVLQVAAIHLTYLSTSFLLFLGFNWIVIRDRQQRLELEKNRITLKSLRTQINPHFLFNSLNNIYALAQISNKKTSQYIMNLSDSLRYMTYDVDAPFVPLKKDLKHLENYISLEKIRFDDADDIALIIEGDTNGIPIAPLLFLPLVENAFKYMDPSRPLFNCIVSIEPNMITFQSTNSTRKIDHDTTGGLGLVNLRQRLDLLYPDKHSFRTEDNLTEFSTSLKLTLN